MPIQYRNPAANVMIPMVPVTQKLTPEEVPSDFPGGTQIAQIGYKLPMVNIVAQIMLSHLFSLEMLDHLVLRSKIRRSNSPNPTKNPKMASIVKEYIPTYVL